MSKAWCVVRDRIDHASRIMFHINGVMMNQDLVLAKAPAKSTNRLAALAEGVRRNWLLYLLILPTFVFAITFYYYPLSSGIYHSFTYWDIKRTLWIGLENYQRMFDDPAAVTSWRNMVTILIAQLVIVVTTPLLGAALVAHLRPGFGQFWWRMAFIMPIVVPATVVVFVWRWFYGPDGGLNTLLRLSGMGNLAHIWLGENATALWAIIFTGFPWVAGLNFLLYLAALQSIPEELLDAARVDGAGAFRRFFQIELPLIRNQMMVLITLTFIFYLRSFDAPLIMTNGGPGTAGTLVPGLQMYHAVRDDLDLGYGSAIGTVLFVVTLSLMLINQILSNRQKSAV
jgi:raffinose/stachyose/melibiose transport system permease protein